MKILQRHILETAIRWCSNILVEALSNAELEEGDARTHMKKALEHLSLAATNLRIK